MTRSSPQPKRRAAKPSSVRCRTRLRDDRRGARRQAFRRPAATVGHRSRALEGCSDRRARRGDLSTRHRGRDRDPTGAGCADAGSNRAGYRPPAIDGGEIRPACRSSRRPHRRGRPPSRTATSTRIVRSDVPPARGRALKTGQLTGPVTPGLVEETQVCCSLSGAGATLAHAGGAAPAHADARAGALLFVSPGRGVRRRSAMPLLLHDFRAHSDASLNRSRTRWAPTNTLGRRS
jgi:hypothetical protein